MPQFDVIVVGTGGVGAAALWRLASRGLKTLGLDQFDPPHDQGSTHGQTRIIRQAYFEHPDYVPLALRSYELWSALEQSVGASLFRQTGLLQVGPPDGPVVQGVLRSARQHRLPVELLAADEVARRWPALRMPPDAVGVFEQRGGLLHVEACVTSCLAAARAAGADLRAHVEVLGWEGDDALTVRTTAGDFTTARLIVTAGPWAGRWLRATGVALQVLRKTLCWFAADDPQLHADAGLPCYLYELPHGVFYGFPALDGRGLKAAEHSGGLPCPSVRDVPRAISAADCAPTESFVRDYLPEAGPRREAATCLYTMSRDEHFIVDCCADDRRVAFAAGLSGHGFKFAPALGEALADLATCGTSSLPIGFLGLAGRELGPGAPSSSA